MLHKIRCFFDENQEALPDIALIALFLTPAYMTISSYEPLECTIITLICLFAGWFLGSFGCLAGILICLVVLWTVGYYTAIKDGNDYGYVIGTIMFITNLPYWLFAKYGLRKFLRESKKKKG